MMSLEKFGFDAGFRERFRPYQNKGYVPARIVAQHKGRYVVHTENGILSGKLSGKFIYQSDVRKDYPVVGDWVAIKTVEGEESVIYAVLPRKNSFSRKMAISGGRKIRNGVIVGGNIEEQVLSANIDTAFIVTGLDDNFSIGRIERYITLVKSSGVHPVILLNKCDLVEDASCYKEKVRAVAKDIEIHSISASAGIHMNVLDPYTGPGQTIVFFGSSGVGKSTIVNYLFHEDVQKTGATSEANGKGRHTTTGSQLLFHESGCAVIDTPGMRELQLWADEEVLMESFHDIHVLAEGCRYRDCRHEEEDHCRVRAAIAEGKLDAERFQHFKSQQKELVALKSSRESYYKDRSSHKKKKSVRRNGVDRSFYFSREKEE